MPRVQIYSHDHSCEGVGLRQPSLFNVLNTSSNDIRCLSSFWFTCIQNHTLESHFNVLY